MFGRMNLVVELESFSPPELHLGRKPGLVKFRGLQAWFIKILEGTGEMAFHFTDFFVVAYIR